MVTPLASNQVHVPEWDQNQLGIDRPWRAIDVVRPQVASRSVPAFARWQTSLRRRVAIRFPTADVDVAGPS